MGLGTKVDFGVSTSSVHCALDRACVQFVKAGHVYNHETCTISDNTRMACVQS